MKTAIATVLHDPNLIVHRKLSIIAKNHADIFKDNFFTVLSKDTPTFAYVIIIPEATLFVQSGRGIADARRCCLRWFLNVPAFADCDRILLADFDRLLYWLEHDKDSLVGVLDSYTLPNCVIGRTEAAMQSHPEVQRNTERAINAYTFFKLFPEENTEDFLAGTYLLTKPMIEYILARSFAMQPGAVDVEWYALMRESGIPVDHVKVDGLGYEGVWLGLEPSQDLGSGLWDAINRKRYDNLDQSKAMVDIIKTWRQS